MKRLLIAAVVAVSSFSAQAAQVILFSCQTAEKEKVVALKDEDKGIYSFELFKPNGQRGLHVEMAEQEMTLVRRYRNDGDVNSLIFTVGDINYAVTVSGKGKDITGDAEVTRMGTEVYYSKCEPKTITHKLDNKAMIGKVSLID